MNSQSIAIVAIPTYILNSQSQKRDYSRLEAHSES